MVYYYYYTIRKVSKKEEGVRYIAVAIGRPNLSGGGNTKRKAKKMLKEALSMFHSDSKVKMISIKKAGI